MSWDNKNLRCYDCKFWWPEDEEDSLARERSDLGQCRRLAPPATIVDAPDQSRRYPIWAITRRNDWCGEHQHVQLH